MSDFKKLYFTLFGKVADAVDQLDAALPETGMTPDLLGVYRARVILIDAMRKAEEAYISADEEAE